MSDKHTAVIIGAGIGGLGVGVALRQAGRDIRIHEQAASRPELGLGLGLEPNALSALHELGVAEPVVRAGARLAKIELRYTDDAVALGLPLAGSGRVEQGLRRYETVRSRRTRAFVRLGPRIAQITTTTNVAIRTVRSVALRLTPEHLLALSARSFQRDSQRELRPQVAA